MSDTEQTPRYRTCRVLLVVHGVEGKQKGLKLFAEVLQAQKLKKDGVWVYKYAPPDHLAKITCKHLVRITELKPAPKRKTT